MLDFVRQFKMYHAPEYAIRVVLNHAKYLTEIEKVQAPDANVANRDKLACYFEANVIVDELITQAQQSQSIDEVEKMYHYSPVIAEVLRCNDAEFLTQFFERMSNAK